jgi:GxxExxY protein
MLPLFELSDRIIGAAIHVHRALGPGFLESIYETALCLELSKRKISFVRQYVVPVLYEGVEVGEHHLDLFVADEMVVELKAVRALEPVHFAIVRSYLRAVGRGQGLLLNFARPALEIKRVFPGPDGPLLGSCPSWVPDEKGARALRAPTPVPTRP